MPGLLDEAPDVRDDCVALMSQLDDSVLYVDDEECGIRTVRERGHGLAGLPLLTWGNLSGRS
jgi:hypothetical protein